MSDLSSMVSKDVDTEAVVYALRKLADNIEAGNLQPVDYKVDVYESLGKASVGVKVERVERVEER